MKENKISIILVVLSVMMILVTAVFCCKIFKVEEKPSNVGISDMHSTRDKNVTNNDKINMSKYYINSNLGKVAEIYNKMLDTLGSQSYISYLEQSIYSDGIYNRNHELDLKNYISKYEGEDSGGKGISYEQWNGTLQTRYSYYEQRGTWEKSTFNWFEKADIIYSFMSYRMIITNDDEYEFSYEENINRNNSFYHKIIAKYSGDDDWKKEKITMYIEANTMKLKEVEISSETIIDSNLTINGQNNYYFEYSDKVLKIPEEILDI